VGHAVEDIHVPKTDLLLDHCWDLHVCHGLQGHTPITRQNRVRQKTGSAVVQRGMQPQKDDNNCLSFSIKKNKSREF
jgi:hypothetical protein